MSATTDPNVPARERLVLTVLSIFAAACMLAAALLTAQVMGKLDQYGRAKQDNLHWTMSQLEVDLLRFQLSLERLPDINPGSFVQLRRQFDLLYSRIMTLQRGDVYPRAIRDALLEDELTLILSLLAEMVPVIDAPDPQFEAGRDRLAALAGRMMAPIRTVATEAITVDARRSDAERAALTSQIVTLTILILLMVTALFTLLITLWRLYRNHRLRAEDSRRTSNRLATILNTSQDAILVIDSQGRLLESNGRARRMFDLPPQGADDVRFADLVTEAEDGRMDTARLMEACAERPFRSDRLTGHSLSGRSFAAELSADLAARGDAPVCICFVRDISARRAAHAEIASAHDRALAGEQAKARFLGMISHEMRTPLNGILGALDLLEDTGMDSEQQSYTRIMRSSGKLLLTQITDALDITLAESGKLRLNFTEFNLDQLLSDLLDSQSTAAAARGNRLRLLTPAGQLGMVTGDPDRLHQVLLNLLSNAIKFTRNGEITLEAWRQDQADEVEFQVADTGVGISEVDLPHVFDDFMRADPPGEEQPEGTGLGLGIARQLAGLMGGSVGAESELGEGSLFWLRLPLPSPAARPVTSPVRADASPGPAMAARVLVVEDNPNNRMVVETMLSRDGHQVTLAHDGITGVAAAQAAFHDLILMDVNMPRMDGIEAARAIRSGDGPCAQTRIVALTAHAGTEVAETLLQAGIDEVQTKPLSREALRRVLAGGAVVSPAQPTAEALPCLDHHYLDQLGHSMPDARIAEILRMFETEGGALITALDRDYTLPDDTLVDRLHHLAGTAATCGARAFQAALAESEAAVLSGDHRARAMRLATLPVLWTRTRAALRAYRDGR
ncbi:aerobic respiration control sensor protein ArcB [Roseovarius sp. A-2]|uniref:hybrid sensor histidine kinase/response regulator n=1 Tax=Roseovarius sp. A-2 TaxID=1570360 RepID=UPI0009B5752E|nr:ATP-binding protein [Roseovarius sp. A-2]GAW34961.1 aerobic respiration control sensor protein ArcB [Roseovarius sp. A-2]